MADTPKVYRIETIADLLKVPPDRRGACMREIEYSLALIDLACGDEVEVSLPFIDWCDDGDKSSTLKVGEEELTLKIYESEKS